MSDHHELEPETGLHQGRGTEQRLDNPPANIYTLQLS